jgi:ferritin-like metal-binding protein YciE
MEVHHHAHTARKKWPHYFWEFLMLFLAVFCGFLAEYQLEHKIEKERAKEYAKALYNDIVSDTAHLESVIQQTKDHLPYLDTLLNFILKKSIEKKKIPGATLYYYSTKIRKGTFLSFKTANLAQLINSGSLRLLKNKELITLITEYDQAITAAQSWGESKMSQLDDFIENISQVFSFFETRKLNYLLSQYPGKIDSLLNLDFPLQNSDEKSLSDLSYVLASRQSTLRSRINRYYAEPLKVAKQLIEALKKEYHLK